MSNFVQIGPSIVEILRFFDFPNGHHCHVGFLNSWYFIGWRRPKVPVASMCKIASKLDSSIVDILQAFEFSRYLPPPSLICNILLAARVQRAETHHHFKFCHNWSIRQLDIAIVWFCKMSAALRRYCIFLKMAITAILDFWNHEFLLANRVQKVLNTSVCQISSKLFNRLRR